MKYTVTGDIHLNLSKNTEWEVSRFNKYIDVLVENKASSDILVLSGDIFDKPRPLLEEIKLFYEALKKLSKAYKDIFIIDGNHERADVNLTTFDSLPNVYFTYYKCYELKDEKFTITLLSHSQLHLLKELPTKSNNILISHFRCDVPPHIKEEVDVTYISKNFDYCIASDIHMHYKPYLNIEYTSQPYNTNYKEKEENGYMILGIEDGTYNIEYKSLDLPNKLKLTMTADEYKCKFEELKNNINLYKIVIEDEANNTKDLPINDNIMLSFRPKIYVDKEQENEIKEEIKSNGFINIPDTLKRLVRDSEEITDEATLRAGENLVNMIVKGDLW